SDALAILGSRPGKVVTTAVEHPAVSGACASASECVRVPVFGSGELDLDALRRALPGASLCSVMAANNETGVIFPLREIAAMCRDYGIPLHVDAVQAAGKMPLDFPWDLLTLSAHKISGPKGAGILATRRKVSAVQSGGHRRGGGAAGRRTWRASSEWARRWSLPPRSSPPLPGASASCATASRLPRARSLVHAWRVRP